ncbi:GntR family transcriptional regulator [Marinomonas spartinae]|uniref:GntR family transcriptional regulator n=1 Tax=Marinomonas spartinae TaxID=1792290 RepID=UPI0018F20111|nr:FCD domain-containing protein [Marinomonas spartinae]MBJ7556653.1 GntR family transcriptional regulator [Marinomonas spartinae]
MLLIAALVEEGFLVSVPYEGYFVQSFNNKNLKDLCEMRIGLETLAFKLIWDHRTDKFADTLATRNEDLKQAIVAEDKTCAIEKELALHATVYEFSDNELLLGAWKTLSGRLQLYWSLHQKAQHRLGARIDGHDIYIRLATGNDLNAMIAEIEEHMARGMQSVSDSI